MKVIASFLFALSLNAQMVTTTITDQGSDIIRQVTGQTVKPAKLLSAITCSDAPEADASVATGRIYREIQLKSTQHITLYSSEVIDAVLAEMQSRDVFNRLYKAGAAASEVTAILLTAFKTSPLIATILQIAPPLYLATVGVVHSERDLQEFSKKILNDNTTIVLPKNGCFTSLVVGKSASAIETEKITIQ